MSIRQRGATFSVETYDPETQQKKHVASFSTRREAEIVDAEVNRYRPRKCIACGKRYRPRSVTQRRCKPKCGIAKRPALPDGDHWLYRCFDGRGLLLYVGVTSVGLQRHKAHGGQPWWKLVTMITVEHFETRADVLAAELRAIKAENPMFNVVGAVDGAPLLDLATARAQRRPA